MTLGIDPAPTGAGLTPVAGGQFVLWRYADSTAAVVFGTLKIAWLFNAGSVMWTSFVLDLGVTDFAPTDGAVLWLVTFEATEIPLHGSVSPPTTGPWISVTEAL